jgi:hypothetical protein
MNDQKEAKYFCPNHGMTATSYSRRGHRCPDCNQLLKQLCPHCGEPKARGSHYIKHTKMCLANGNIPQQPQRKEHQLKPMHLIVFEGPWNAMKQGIYSEMIEKSMQRDDIKEYVRRTYIHFKCETDFINGVKRLSPMNASIILIAGDGCKDGIEYYQNGNQKFISLNTIISALKENQRIEKYCFWVHIGACDIGKEIQKLSDLPWNLSGYNCTVRWNESALLEQYMICQCAFNDNIDINTLKRWAMEIKSLGSKFVIVV